jgi:hypothetical protein
MELTFVAKDPDSVPDGSPAWYRTDRKYVPRPRLTMTSLPGSGDFYVFDDTRVMFLHYAGNGTNTAFEITDEPQATRACQEAFENVWQIATPLREYRPA